MHHETLKEIKAALVSQNVFLKSIVESLDKIVKKVCRLADEFAPEDKSDSELIMPPQPSPTLAPYATP